MYINWMMSKLMNKQVILIHQDVSTTDRIERINMKSAIILAATLATALVGASVQAASSDHSSMANYKQVVALNGESAMPAPNMSDAQEAKSKAQRDARRDPTKKVAATPVAHGEGAFPTGEGVNAKKPETRDAELEARNAKRAEKRGGKAPLVKASARPEAPMKH
ncbi:hypothetical protein [Rhodoferax koreensis]|uniref:hypothetical protein n=1 Tax=Rhodoferax koreensis TaxID=1842727 RepID=UPI0012FF7390|nr:hypothetical protein [Rhodoferax koreense]